jgi:hypothetical protein
MKAQGAKRIAADKTGARGAAVVDGDKPDPEGLVDGIS